MANPKVQAAGTPLIQHARDWFDGRGWEPFPFQLEMMEEFLAGKSGLLNAPTGSGKTYGLWIPILLDWIRRHPKTYKTKEKNARLFLHLCDL